MHLAIPPPPVRNPEKGFKTRPKKTRTESVSTNETESPLLLAPDLEDCGIDQTTIVFD
ncbi:hypothetical protein PCG10_000263 [Penicillium crustosum]|uniref:Uncharacterized protein n=1 Tax=Penicillium crustosum TaxID=36656 RepID=A0A9P5GSZ0_PENCR|nr:hypothetical protein PCG10_000263 [Penicillium crustosum]